MTNNSQNGNLHATYSFILIDSAVTQLSLNASEANQTFIPRLIIVKSVEKWP